MPNFCTKVMQTVLKQKSETFTDGIPEIILGNGLRHIFLIWSSTVLTGNLPLQVLQLVYLLFNRRVTSLLGDLWEVSSSVKA